MSHFSVLSQLYLKNVTDVDCTSTCAYGIISAALPACYIMPFFLLPPAGAIARQQLPPYFEGYYVIPYNDENGLPSNDVTGFFEDAKGYCWFTPQFGLIRFDGGGISGITIQATCLPLLPTDFIHSIQILKTRCFLPMKVPAFMLLTAMVR